MSTLQGSKEYRVIKTNKLMPGVCSSARIIGKELQAKLNAGEVIEVNLEQLNQLKKYGWVVIQKEKENVKSSETKKSRDSSAD